MEITRLEVYRREKEGSRLKAFVDFTLDDCLAIRGAKIIEGNSRLFVSMPGKLNKDGKEENVVFPTNKETREKFEKVILDEYNKYGSWDSYLSMDNWQQSIKDYTSVPVYFNRDIMQRVTTEQNGVSTVACSFATVRSIEDIQKEWDERIKEGEKIKTSIREVLKQNYPNAENMTWGIVGSPVEMTFDEFVKYMEEENRKWVESNKVDLAK